jgi:hypothetical protein
MQSFFSVFGLHHRAVLEFRCFILKRSLSSGQKKKESKLKNIRVE